MTVKHDEKYLVPLIFAHSIPGLEQDHFQLQVYEDRDTLIEQSKQYFNRTTSGL